VKWVICARGGPEGGDDGACSDKSGQDAELTVSADTS